MYASCCLKWYECSECHDDKSDHLFVFSKRVKLTCKSCRKRFDRDFEMFSAKDCFCNFCGVRWSMPGETPESKIYQECKALLSAALMEQLKPEHAYFSEL